MSRVLFRVSSVIMLDQSLAGWVYYVNGAHYVHRVYYVHGVTDPLVRVLVASYLWPVLL